MEHHIASNKDSQSHFYLPPTMLDIGGILTAMLALNIRPMVNLISSKILRDIEREGRKPEVVEMPSGARTKHLFEVSIGCFEQWSVAVVGVKLKAMSKMPMLPQQQYNPYANNMYGSMGAQYGGMPGGGQGSSQYQPKRRKLLHNVDKTCTQWSRKGSCSYGSECKFRHEGGEQATAPAAMTAM